MVETLTFGGVELREASGESFSTTVKDGTLTIVRNPGGGAVAIDVDDVQVPWTGEFKRVDTRTFMLNTPDLMAFSYVTLPKGLPDATYERFADALAALKSGAPLPKATAGGTAAEAAAAPAAPAAAAVAEGGSAAAPAPASANTNPIGDLLKAVAAKAAHDTAAVGEAIRKKAEHDIRLMQEQQAAAKAAQKPA